MKIKNFMHKCDQINREVYKLINGKKKHHKW